MHWQSAATDTTMWLPLYYDGFYSGTASKPTWSPDGRQIAFGYTDYTPPQFYDTRLEIWRADGTAGRCAFDAISLAGVTWSPITNEIAVSDGGRIVVTDPNDCRQLRDF